MVHQLTRNAPQRIARMQRMAKSVVPDAIAKDGEFLGAGLMGGAYRYQVGQDTFIVKQMGHSESIAGQLQTHTPKEFELKAAKQVAVQNALAGAGFPVATAAVVEGSPDWVVMEEVKGLELDDLSDDEKKQLDFGSLREQMEPTVDVVLDRLAAENPEHAGLYRKHLDVSSGNARFLRDNGQVLVAGIFDPVV